VCCLALSAAFLGPRFAFFLVWIFGERVEHVYSTWIWPLLGVIFIPWTSLAYIIVWGPVHHVSGAGWILVAIGVFLDLATWSGRFAKSRYDASRT
jgi:quinol-cytochrome oxidoreductase complex cytochrome b subunit